MKESNRTNSKVGSYHWFHTLIGQNLRIGEYLKDKTPTDMLPEQMPNFFYVDRWYGLSPHYLYRINKLFTEVNKQYYGNKSWN